MAHRKLPMVDVHIALLRGIDVGGQGKQPMTELRELINGLGARDVVTYIQRGNVAYKCDLEAASNGDTIEKAKGFRPKCITLTATKLSAVILANPFPEAIEAPKTLHVFSFEDAPDIDAATLSTSADYGEGFRLDGGVFYLHTPDGLRSPKTASVLERRLGVAASGRNWTTVVKLAEMAGAI